MVGAEASYEWYRDGRLVASSSEPTFGIVSASAADVGTYTVKARNRYGETTSTPIVVGVSRGRAGSVDPIVVPGTRDHGPVEVLMAWTSRREWAVLSPGLRRLTFLDSDLKSLRTATLPGTGPLEVHCFAAGPDGSLWMGGRLEFPGRPSTSVVRVLADGTLDREFFTADGNVAYEAYDTRDGGVLVVVGRSTLVRYTASGSPHPTFVPPAHHILCAAVQPDGKIVYGWQEKPGPAEDPPLNVARMSAEGVPDPTFVAPSIVLPLTGGGTYALQTVRRIWIAANGNILTNLEPSSMLAWLSAKGDHLSLITDPGSYGGWNVHALTDEGCIIADRPVYPRNPVYVRPDGTVGPPLFNDFSSDNRTPPSAPSPDVLLVRTWTGPNHDPTFSFQRVNLRSRGSSTLINLSGRGHTGIGSETFIAGFVTRTTSNQPLLLRGVGGGLADFGVSGVASNPLVELYAGETRVAGNDDWDETAARAAAIRAAERDRGAFPLRSGAGDSAISQAVPPGMHTLQLQPGKGSAGVGLAEIYAPSGAKLVNLSLRGSVRSGERSLIGGFVIEGTGPRWVLLRAVGPGLAAFGISDFVPDPQLEVMSGSIRVASNNDWSQGDQYALIESAQRKAGAFALLPGSKDAAVVVELMPGQYSCVVSPGTVATGVGLLEIYHLD